MPDGRAAHVRNLCPSCGEPREHGAPILCASPAEHRNLPLVLGEVCGWRAWRLVGVAVGEPRLRSLYHDVVWPTDEYLISDGRHGICAATDRDSLEDQRQYGRADGQRYVEIPGVCIGTVALAGEIIEGTRGYRAEKARVTAIILPYANWGVLRALSRAYRVPVALGNIVNRGEMSWT